MPEKILISERARVSPARSEGIWWLETLEDAQDRGEQRGDLRGRQRVRIEQPGDRAQQVAEQGVGARDGLDQRVDRVRADPQAQQVQIDRPEMEAEDLACALGRRDGRSLSGLRLAGDARRDENVAAGDAAALEATVDGAAGEDLAVLRDEAVDRVRA